MGLANAAIEIGSKIGAGAAKISNVLDDAVINPGLKNLEKAVAEEGAKAGKEVAEEATEEVTEKAIKKVSSGIGKNSFVGGAVGSITGAGIGGVAGLATGADEDDTKSMIFMGALAGATGGSIIGGSSKMLRNKAVSGKFFSQVDRTVAETAEEIATGKANHAVKNGANGLFNKIGSSTQSITDKIDDIGSNVAKRATRETRFELAKGIKKNSNLTSKQALELANEAASSSSEDLRKGVGIKFEDGSYSKVLLRKNDIDELTKSVRTGNTLGGAVQGTVMGSVTGATIGGIAGGVDEDETFIGGALKGGLIGAGVGGAGGGALGYSKNSARLLSSITSKV